MLTVMDWANILGSTEIAVPIAAESAEAIELAKLVVELCSMPPILASR